MHSCEEGIAPRRAALLGIVVGELRALLPYAVDVRRFPDHQALMVDTRLHPADVVAHDEQDVGLLLLLRGRRHACHCHSGEKGQQPAPDVSGNTHGSLIRRPPETGRQPAPMWPLRSAPICEHAMQIGEFKFTKGLVRSSPRQIPSARAANTSDVRTTLSVGVESAIRAAIAVLSAPPALRSSIALRKEHGGDTEDGRENECSKHDFISVLSWVYRSATTPRSSLRFGPGCLSRAPLFCASTIPDQRRGTW